MCSASYFSQASPSFSPPTSTSTPHTRHTQDHDQMTPFVVLQRQDTPRVGRRDFGCRSMVGVHMFLRDVLSTTVVAQGKAMCADLRTNRVRSQTTRGIETKDSCSVKLQVARPARLAFFGSACATRGRLSNSGVVLFLGVHGAANRTEDTGYVCPNVDSQQVKNSLDRGCQEVKGSAVHMRTHSVSELEFHEKNLGCRTLRCAKPQGVRYFAQGWKPMI